MGQIEGANEITYFTGLGKFSGEGYLAKRLLLENKNLVGHKEMLE